ncbi:5'-nucleotidase C-terminal domain-containing protein [Flavobacterium sp.]|jgi:2',3'-cyclic-nucleotide 2'-phosphodiesterase (5'-nucleotidase family)|uniref:5'-nucleotidase C-terminal domain-containing protein n=1 Tax=Flavobacterium sp. TaxID=239 RepID=UPI0037BF6C71
MVNLKNYNGVVKLFVLLLTFIAVISCAQKKYVITRIEGKQIGITDKNSEVADIENFIKPYRSKIDADLNKILANAPETIDKSGEWQTPMGNFLADITFEKSDNVFQMREKKSIDICLLNNGGIRSIIPKGDVTARTAYEVMPFENNAIVIALKADQIIEMISYIISEKKPHPLQGMTFTIDNNNQPKNILVQGKPLDDNTIYYVVTSDYLSNGGDNMLFFKKGVAQYNIDYKLRNIIIDYFMENKIITANKDVRISKE